MTSTPALRDIWPAELVSLTLTVHLEAAELDFRGIRVELDGVPGFEVREHRISGTIRPRSTDPEFHGHFWARKESAKGGISVDFEVVPGTVKSLDAPAPDVFDFADRLNSHLTPSEPTIRGVLAARFKHSLRSHKPAVTLPIVVPGLLQSEPGTSIVGLEFGFSSKAQPLRRVYIGLYEEQERIAIQLTLALEVSTLRGLPAAMCSAAVQHIGAFVSPIASGGEQ
jgi:hypothetical protein